MSTTNTVLSILGAAAATALLLSILAHGASPQASPTAAPDSEVTTFAEEYGLNRSDVGSFDAALSARLIRFGTVAAGRGRHAEAKRFFWKAILVDPTSTLAWKNYDQAVLHVLADRVDRSPGLVGLPGLADEPAQAAPEEPQPEEGC
ncbi:hypothetical protein [Desulfocurvus sp. DL9XJH121]